MSGLEGPQTEQLGGSIDDVQAFRAGLEAERAGASLNNCLFR
jgi:hypothetical protein